MLFGLFLLLHCSCVDNEATGITISVNVNESLNTPVSIYDLFGEISLISIDSSQFISNSSIRHTAECYTCGKGYFFILDKTTQKIHVVDSLGTYILTDNHVGRGPGEYTLATTIQFDEESGLLNILDPRGRILQYDFNLDCLRFINEVEFLKYQNLGNSFYINGADCILTNINEMSPLSYLNINTGEYRILEYEVPEWYFDCWYPTPHYFEISNQLYYYEYHNGSVYSVDKEGVKPFLRFDFGRYTCNLDDIPEYDDAFHYSDWILNESSYVLPIYSMVGFGDIILARCLYKGGQYTMIYNLRNKNCSFFSRTIEDLMILPGIASGGLMYSFVDSSSINDYICVDILDSSSRIAYEEIINNDGCGFIVYKPY